MRVTHVKLNDGRTLALLTVSVADRFVPAARTISCHWIGGSLKTLLTSFNGSPTVSMRRPPVGNRRFTPVRLHCCRLLFSYGAACRCCHVRLASSSAAAAAAATAAEEPEHLVGYPDQAEVPLATVQGGGNVAYYIVKTGTSDGRSWATHKRFSEFVALRTTLLASGQATKVGTIPFPAKSLWGGSDASRVRERTKELNTWIAAVLTLCRVDGNRDLAMFLAQVSAAHQF
eukprot:COSAG05_NODE_503_length_9211_cov_44.051361_5_plen_230_part_00